MIRAFTRDDGTRRHRRDRRDDGNRTGRGQCNPFGDPRSNAPRSNDDPAAQETAAVTAKNAAVTAAAAGDVTTAIAEQKKAAGAAAAARSGSNSSGDAAGAASAANAEAAAADASSISLASCSVSEWRTRGGTATLIGHSEFADAGASTPPKKYLVKTRVGDITQCVFTEADACVTPGASSRYVSSGSCTYSATTGATTDTLSQSQYDDTNTCSPSTLVSTSALNCNLDDTATPATACHYSLTVSKTVVALASIAGCCIVSSHGFTQTGGRTTTLTTEDTDANAIGRLNAGTAWSAWTTSSGVAKYESRTAGFGFAYTEVEFRATVSIPSGVTGTAKVAIYRRTYGVGSYALYRTDTFVVTGGSGDVDNIAMTIPNDIGYETYVACLPGGS